MRPTRRTSGGSRSPTKWPISFATGTNSAGGWRRPLGRAALDVLDGLRPATTDERIAAALRGVCLAPHVHLMSRTAEGRPLGEFERDAEDRADRLAFELLAPAAEIPDEHDRAALTARLVSAFGFSASAAREYAHVLLPDPPPAGLLVERFAKLW